MATREVEETTTVKRKIIVYICDECGAEDFCSLETCFICGRDVCSKCCRYMPENKKLWHEYEHCCCNGCWDAGKDRIAKMDAAEELFRTLFENEIFMWKQDMKGHLHGK